MFYEALEERMEGLHQILLATPDTERNISMALRLLRLFRRKGMRERHPQLIVALFREEEGAVSLLEGDSGVLFQQVNENQFTYRDLILRKGDRQAEALHQRYRGGRLLVPAWQSLGTFTQNSNRAVVWDIPNKLLLAGKTEDLSQEERESLYWQLARYEHRRWNAFHYARGWTRLPVEELTEEEVKACRTKRPEEKRHTCLVSWEELDALPQSKPGILKYYDYENVADLFKTREKEDFS